MVEIERGGQELEMWDVSACTKCWWYSCLENPHRCLLEYALYLVLVYYISTFVHISIIEIP